MLLFSILSGVLVVVGIVVFVWAAVSVTAQVKDRFERTYHTCNDQEEGEKSMNHKPRSDALVPRWKGDILEVWIPPVDHAEGERVLCLDKSYLPVLVATLKNALGER